MTHVVITIRREDDETPAIRSKDYKDKADVCADVENIMRFIGSHI
jgi:hypothetical protein